MEAFDFQLRTRLIYGAGTIERLGKLARELGTRKVLLVTDTGLVRAGHALRAERVLVEAGNEVRMFDGTRENPTTQDVETCLDYVGVELPDLIVGIGGGSSIDTAKGTNLLLTNGGRMEDYWGSGKAREPMLPSIGVPTTAGTGSEAQSYALIAQAEPEPGMRHGRKMACGDPKARFRTVLLDPELLASAPRRALGAAAIDAVSHAVESYVTKRRNPVSTMLAREAWRLLEESFEAFLGDPGDREAAGAMLLGAHLAGAAIEASMLGAAHAAANPLTAAYGTAHGVAVGLMLPHVVRFNGFVAGDLYGELAEAASGAAADARAAGGRSRAWVTPGEVDSGKALAARIERLRRAAGLPEHLGDCGVERERLPELARLATREWTGTFNPRLLAEADFLKLYELASAG